MFIGTLNIDEMGFDIDPYDLSKLCCILVIKDNPFLAGNFTKFLDLDAPLINIFATLMLDHHDYNYESYLIIVIGYNKRFAYIYIINIS